MTERVIGRNLHGRIWDEVRRIFPGARRCGLVVDARVAALWPLSDPEPGTNLDVIRCSVPPGEAAKERVVLADLQDRLVGLRRTEPVIVMGGGATLDVGGFAAATVRRGLPWIGVATTVVAMADASIGGKVAVNHPRGKNLLGTFHLPSLVISDVGYLETLDPRDRTAGLAEVYKCGRIGDAALLDDLARGVPSDAAAWTDVIERAVRVKLHVVEQDLHDLGPRRLLNYGHTLGHALERVLGNEKLRHGEAIAIGMHAAARIALHRGLIAREVCDAQQHDMEALGLPTAVPGGTKTDALFEALSIDKKRAPGEAHTWILPTGRTGVAVHEDVTDDEIRVVL